MDYQQLSFHPPKQQKVHVPKSFLFHLNFRKTMIYLPSMDEQPGPPIGDDDD